MNFCDIQKVRYGSRRKYIYIRYYAIQKIKFSSEHTENNVRKEIGIVRYHKIFFFPISARKNWIQGNCKQGVLYLYSTAVEISLMCKAEKSYTPTDIIYIKKKKKHFASSKYHFVFTSDYGIISLYIPPVVHTTAGMLLS